MITSAALVLTTLSSSTLGALLAPLVIGMGATILLVPVLLLVSLAVDPVACEGSDSRAEFPDGAALRLPRG
jgi:hypothetical protein